MPGWRYLSLVSAAAYAADRAGGPWAWTVLGLVATGWVLQRPHRILHAAFSPQFAAALLVCLLVAAAIGSLLPDGSVVFRSAWFTSWLVLLAVGLASVSFRRKPPSLRRPVPW